MNWLLWIALAALAVLGIFRRRLSPRGRSILVIVGSGCGLAWLYINRWGIAPITCPIIALVTPVIAWHAAYGLAAMARGETFMDGITDGWRMLTRTIDPATTKPDLYTDNRRANLFVGSFLIMAAFAIIGGWPPGLFEGSDTAAAYHETMADEDVQSGIEFALRGNDNAGTFDKKAEAGKHAAKAEKAKDEVPKGSWWLIIEAVLFGLMAIILQAAARLDQFGEWFYGLLRGASPTIASLSKDATQAKIATEAADVAKTAMGKGGK